MCVDVLSACLYVLHMESRKHISKLTLMNVNMNFSVQACINGSIIWTWASF